ncbi:response regulator [bacterium]|nr:response regulator [bacterium]
MNERILIVEDEYSIRTALEILLEEEGYEINCLDNGSEAINLLQGKNYDLVISDIRMPGISGLDMLKEIRKLPSCPGVIMITAYGTIETAIKAMKMGAGDFLVKPFSNDLLKMTVCRVLECREMSQENQRLRELERMKKEFIAIVAHELRTPITSIRGYLKLVLGQKAGKLNPLQNEYLDVVLQNTQKLNRIVDKMIDIAYLETNKSSFQTISTNISGILSEVETAVRNVCELNHLQFEIQQPASLRPIIMDPYRLNQLMHILVDNAISFSPPKGHIWLSANKWKGAGSFQEDNAPNSYVDLSDLENMDYLEITVKDEGPGISEEILTRVFEEFYQAEDIYTRHVGGIGLGLCLCKRIVRVMGGKIWVKSRLGQGCTFTLILPWRYPDEDSQGSKNIVCPKRCEY